MFTFCSCVVECPAKMTHICFQSTEGALCPKLDPFVDIHIEGRFPEWSAKSNPFLPKSALILLIPLSMFFGFNLWPFGWNEIRHGPFYLEKQEQNFTFTKPASFSSHTSLNFTNSDQESFGRKLWGRNWAVTNFLHLLPSFSKAIHQINNH